MAPVPGLPLESSRRPAGLPTTYAPSSAVFPQELPAGPGPPIQTGPLAPDDSPPFFGGGAAQNSCARETHWGFPQPTIRVTTDASHMRWGALPGPQYLWGLVPLQGTPPYQVLEIQAVILSLLHFLPLVCLRTVVTHGQCYSGGLYKQTRGHPLHTPEELWTWCRRRDIIPIA